MEIISSIFFSEDTEQANFEAMSSGYRNDVYVQLNSGLVFQLNIYHPKRLEQDFQTEILNTGFYLPDNNIVLLNEVDKAKIIDQILFLAKKQYFKSIKPVAIPNIAELVVVYHLQEQNNIDVNREPIECRNSYNEYLAHNEIRAGIQTICSSESMTAFKNIKDARIYQISGKNEKTRNNLVHRISSLFQLSSEYSKNLEGISEGLKDLNWISSRNHALFIWDADEFLKSDAEAKQKFFDMLEKDIIPYWAAKEDCSFTVYLASDL